MFFRSLNSHSIYAGLRVKGYNLTFINALIWIHGYSVCLHGYQYPLSCIWVQCNNYNDEHMALYLLTVVDASYTLPDSYHGDRYSVGCATAFYGIVNTNARFYNKNLINMQCNA